MKLTAVFLVTTALLFADGGSVLLRKQSGPFIVTVFGTPQAALTDFSVLVQNANDRSAILDADVELCVADAHLRATHQQATNKLLYAASFVPTQTGKSHLEVSVTSNGRTAIVEGDIDVAPATPPWISYWPYFALVPATILLFALNQWLKKQRATRRLRAPP